MIIVSTVMLLWDPANHIVHGGLFLTATAEYGKYNNA